MHKEYKLIRWLQSAAAEPQLHWQPDAIWGRQRGMFKLVTSSHASVAFLQPPRPHITHTFPIQTMDDFGFVSVWQSDIMEASAHKSSLGSASHVADCVE